MSVVKSKNPLYNFEIEFGCSENNTCHNISYDRDGKEVKKKLPKFIELKQDKDSNQKKGHKRLIRSRTIKTSKVSFIPESEDQNFAPDYSVQAGKSVSNGILTKGGTLGIIVEINGVKELLGLTNHHVIQNDKERGDDIYNPRLFDVPGTVSRSKVLSGYLTWDRFDTHIDAALYAFTSNSERIASGLSNGDHLSSSLGSASIGLKVKKCGMKTATTTKRIKSTNATVKVHFDDDSKIFKKQLQIPKFSDSGDSGSIIYSVDKKEMVGLLFADNKKLSGGHTYANNINLIFNHEFDVEQELYHPNGNERKKIFQIKKVI
ncbi:hypothetical protein [Gilvibacter sp.]|uniref:hypothetical protein n=1 Tax=Gilvibacter sp. TaxID=2729997 RepID=UPI003B522995